MKIVGGLQGRKSPQDKAKLFLSMAKKSKVVDDRFSTSTAQFTKLNKKSKKSKKSKNASVEEPEDISDSRFEDVHRNPKFARSSKGKDNKIELDDRFAAVLTDDRFKSLPGVGKIDKKGKRVTKGEEEEGEMDAFYKVADANLDSDEDSSESSSEEDPVKEKITFDTPEERIAYLNAVARGEIEISDEESESDFTADEESESEGEDTEFGKVVDGDSGILAERLNAETIEVRVRPRVSVVWLPSLRSF